MLTSALSRTEAGASQTVLVVGEGGVGKTRLARVAAEEAARRGFVVAEGRAYSVESGVPYAIFADAMQPLLRRIDSAALNVLTRGATGELAHVFPGLLAPGTPERMATSEGPADAKARLYWSVVQLIGRLAARQPLLLVLDNLQWADAASLELLHFVARQAQHPGIGGRLLLIGTYVDTERELNPLLRSTEQSLVSLGAARVERLTPLSLDETWELVQRAFDTAPATVRAFATLLHEWTRGNPFFVEETLKSLVESGRLSEHDGRWHGWDVDALALPRSVRDALLERVGRVSAEARATLELMAVLGTRVRYPILRAVSDAPETVLLGALDELRRAHLFAESEPGDEKEGYDFSHPLVRDSVYAALGRPRAQLLHARLAGALERFYGARALAHADELAFHFTRGAAGEPRPKALRYLAEAGRQALSRYAGREAASYLQSALDLLDASGDRDDTGDESLEPQIVESLARARQRLGEREAALTLWHRARRDASARGDLHAVAGIERRMGLLAYAGGHHDQALRHYEAGLDAAVAAGDHELEARIRLAKGNSLQAVGRRDEARREVHVALAIAERLGGAALLARVHRALLLLNAWAGPVHEARAHGERAVSLARESEERLVEWSAHWAMAILSGLTGDSTTIAHHLKESDRLADEIRSPVLRLWTAEVSIEYMSVIGEWRAALALADHAIPAARALGLHALLARLLVWTGLIHRGLGDLDRAGELIEEAWTLAGADRSARSDDRLLDVHAVVPAHTGMAGYLMTIGENQRALEVGEAGLAIADRTGDVAWAVYRLLPFIIETSLYLEDYERAARHNARLRRESLALGHALGLAWADTTDALLTYLNGAARDAVPLLRAAAASLEAVPFVFDAARLRRLVARAMLDAGDPEGAEHELRLAHDVFVRLGAEREIRAVREQLRALGARPPSRVVANGVGALSGRETEIARLVAARKSNKEIATALDISPRTVSTHLSNIFGKLGVTSRGELTDVIRAEPK
jgi:DNA-binding CsgD family transcriptional regulator/tetratricopeptide (TPR) repeat protein